jgi:DhnA family fructose-bisphosphate aldolase class Ia
MLRDWHENLKSERALIETTILNEESKCKIEVVEYKSKMEVEAANFALKLERQKNKFRSMQMKNRFVLACSWGLVVVLMLYPSSNILAS